MTSSTIFDGIAHIQAAFAAVNLNPPSMIVLESHDDGIKFLSVVRRQTRNWVPVIGDPDLGKPIKMADGSVWMEIRVMGITVRWPVNQIVTLNGETHYWQSYDSF